MHVFDLSQILTSLVTTAIGAGASWLAVHVQRVFRDVSAAHCKIRRLEEEIARIKEELPGPHTGGPDHKKGDL